MKQDAEGRQLRCTKCGGERLTSIPRDDIHTFATEDMQTIDYACLDCWHRWPAEGTPFDKPLAFKLDPLKPLQS